MTQSHESPKPYKFGVFELDPSTGELRKQGMKLKLLGQPVEILQMLLERPGEVVTREELQKRLWTSDTFVDFDHSLNAAIKRLRDTLDDSAETPRYVETLARRGYRFIAPVEGAGRALLVDLQPRDATPTAIAPQQSIPAPSLWRKAGLRAFYAAAGLLVLAAILVALGINVWPRRLSSTPALPHIQSIVVLPLENLSRDPDQEYFADGMTEELINNLSKISVLRVSSRTSAMHYKGTRISLSDIARELKVDGVVEGSVQKSGSRVRITAQLIEAPGDRVLWSQSYERDFIDVLALQDDVARAVAREIKVNLTPQEQARLSSARPVNPEALEAYLRANSLAERQGIAVDFKNQLEYYQLAIQKDPSYAPAYAALGGTYETMANFGLMPGNEARQRLKAAAQRAIELDDTLADAHVLLAELRQYEDWNWSAAEKEFKRAIELNPSMAGAHKGYAENLAIMGRMDEALAEIERARVLDPLLPSLNAEVGFLLYCARRYDRAIGQASSMLLEIEPKYSGGAHSVLGLVYEQRGQFDQAIAEFQKDKPPPVIANRPLNELAHAYAVSGKTDEARKILARMKRASQHSFIPAYHFAIVYTGLGEKDEAFRWLNKAVDERRSSIDVFFNVDPRLDPLRSDPKFQALLHRMGLQQ